MASTEYSSKSTRNSTTRCSAVCQDEELEIESECQEYELILAHHNMDEAVPRERDRPRSHHMLEDGVLGYATLHLFNRILRSQEHINFMGGPIHKAPAPWIASQMFAVQDFAERSEGCAKPMRARNSQNICNLAFSGRESSKRTFHMSAVM